MRPAMCGCSKRIPIRRLPRARTSPSRPQKSASATKPCFSGFSTWGCGGSQRASRNSPFFIELRRLELVGGATRRGRREVLECAVRDALVEALDDHRGAPSRFLRLREADNHAEANEEREDEHRARPEPLKRAD